MVVRTDSDVLSKAPVTVKFGDKEYKIAPLTILQGRDWRTKFNEQMTKISSTFAAPATQGSFGSGLSTALLQFPEVVADLVFAFDSSLPSEVILQEGTDEQLAHAFSAVMTLAFPYWSQLKTAIDLAKQK
jgi:hypothetical protein